MNIRENVEISTIEIFNDDILFTNLIAEVATCALALEFV